MRIYIYLFIISIIFSNNSINQEQKKFDWKTNLIPIVGQIQNKKYIKAGVLAISQFYATDKFLSHNSKNQIAKRNTYAWWIVSLYLYGVIDAYVDYNFKNFPRENKKEK